MSRGFVGKDGKRYDNWLELHNANEVVENNLRQTELLQMQAEMMTWQGKQKEQEMLQKQQQEEARIEHEKEMEKQKYEHDKEMRLLQMFDNVSIPYEVFKKFEEELFKMAEVSEEDTKKQFELMAEETQRMTNSSTQRNKILSMIKNNTDESVINQKVEYTDKYKKFEKFINNVIQIKHLSRQDFDILSNSAEIIALSKKAKKAKEMKPIYTYWEIVGIIITIISIYGIKIGFKVDVCVLTMLISGICTLLFRHFRKNAKKLNIHLKQSVNATINAQMAEEERERLSNQAEDTSFEEKIEQIQNKYLPLTKELISKKLEYLYNFRINHYNTQIEKIFYDTGVVKKCMENNVTFQNIDKSNIIAEGTFEDYFLFFNNFEQGYSEYNNKIN